MTVTAQVPRSGPEAGDGSTVAFTYGFLIDADTELVVTVRNTSTEVLTIKTLTTDYSVAGAGNVSGGTVTFVTAPTATEQVAFTRAVPLVQGLDLQNRGVVSPSLLEQKYDDLYRVAQDNAEALGRAVKVDIFNVVDVDQLTANLTVLAGISANVTTVAGIADNVTTVADNTANINQVAADTIPINAASANATSAASSAAAAAASAAAVEPYADRATAIAASVNAGGNRIAVLSPSGPALSYVRDAAGTALTTNGATVNWSPDGNPSFEHFGAEGDGVVNDATAMQAAIDYAKAGGHMLEGVAGATYRYTVGLDASLPAGNSVDWGMDLTGCLMVQDFNGHDSIGFRWSVDGARAGGGKKIMIGGRFANGDSVTSPPIMMDISGTANMICENQHFNGSANTQLRGDSQLNNRASRTMAYYGGVHFPYKATTGITFDTTSGSGVITASAAHFAAGDVGEILTLTNTSGRTERFTVGVYTDTTHVTATVLATTTYTAGTGNWEGAKVSVSGTTATIAGEDWPTNCVGLSIYIAGAGSSSEPIRRKIATRTSGTVVELDTAVDSNVTTSIFGLAAIDFGADVAYIDGAGSIRTNYATNNEMFIENYRGIGLVVNDAVNLYMSDLKIHGEAQPNGSTAASLGHIWAIEWYGDIDGQLAADFVGNAKVTAFNQDGLLKFSGNTRAYLGINQKLVATFNFGTGGLVEFDDVSLIGSVSAVTTLKANLEDNYADFRVKGTITQSGVAPVQNPETTQGAYSMSTDANVTYTVGYGTQLTIVDTSALTALRDLKLGAGGLVEEGTRLLYKCEVTGGFDRRVRSFASNANIGRISAGNIAEFEFDGTDWFDLGVKAITSKT